MIRSAWCPQPSHQFVGEVDLGKSPIVCLFAVDDNRKLREKKTDVSSAHYNMSLLEKRWMELLVYSTPILRQHSSFRFYKLWNVK